MIKWNESLSLNVEEIDNQHKKFLDIVNELLIAMKEGRSKDIQGEIIDKLIGYAFYHFSKEERYMTQANYPETDLHKKEHEAFVDNIIKFKKDHDENKITLSIEMINFMSHWWVNHIRNSDSKFKPYVTKIKVQEG